MDNKKKIIIIINWETRKNFTFCIKIVVTLERSHGFVHLTSSLQITNICIPSLILTMYVHFDTFIMFKQAMITLRGIAATLKPFKTAISCSAIIACFYCFSISYIFLPFGLKATLTFFQSLIIFFLNFAFKNQTNSNIRKKGGIEA